MPFNRCLSWRRPRRLCLYQDVLRAIATHRVADRPDRFEPRLKKRRRNHYGWLTRPQASALHELADQEAAAEQYLLRLLEHREGEHFASLDPALRGY